VIETPIARRVLSVAKETRAKSYLVSLDLKNLKAKEEKMPTKTETTAMILNGTRNLQIIKKQRPKKNLKKSQKKSQKRSQRKKKTQAIL
jgi:hypothetical protein